MIKDEHLLRLIRAHAQKEDQAFSAVTEAIIKDVLASNRHTLATQIQKALGESDRGSKKRNASFLTQLPKSCQDEEPLINLRESKVSEEQVILSGRPKAQILRLFDEHHQKTKLAEYGYTPKTKILFWGPSGCGKSLTAAFVAHELGLPLGTVRLNAVISSYLGDTASHIQRLFDMAEQMPMVLFLDEIDSIAKQRDDPNDVGELKRIVNSLLQAIDSFETSDSIVIAASNHQYLLDPAVWRRFDDIIGFPIPSKSERELYVKTLMSGVTLKGSFSGIVKALEGLSFADIKRILIESVKTALLNNEESVSNTAIIEQIRFHKKSTEDALKNIILPE